MDITIILSVILEVVIPFHSGKSIGLFQINKKSIQFTGSKMGASIHPK